MDMALRSPSTTVRSSPFPTLASPISTVKPRVSFPQSLNPVKPLKIDNTRPIRVAVGGGGGGGTAEQKWTLEGVITESLSNGMFKVRVGNGDEVLGHISGKIRQNHIRILIGDMVKVEVSRYDSARGRITFRVNKDKDKDKNNKKSKKK